MKSTAIAHGPVYFRIPPGQAWPQSKLMETLVMFRGLLERLTHTSGFDLEARLNQYGKIWLMWAGGRARLHRVSVFSIVVSHFWIHVSTSSKGKSPSKYWWNKWQSTPMFETINPISDSTCMSRILHFASYPITANSTSVKISSDLITIVTPEALLGYAVPSWKHEPWSRGNISHGPGSGPSVDGFFTSLPC